MRIFVIIALACGLLFAGFKILQYIKFDTTISVSIAKGPLKGVNFKLTDYKVSIHDLTSKNEFWSSPLGQSIFQQLSTSLQTLIIAGSEYVTIEVDVNYWGLMRQRFSIENVSKNYKLGIITTDPKINTQ